MNILLEARNYLAKSWLNHDQRIRKYGFMTKLQIDSKKQTIHVELDLKGESASIEADGSYTLIDERGEAYIVLDDVKTSREWINVLLGELKPPLRFAVPKPFKIIL